MPGYIKLYRDLQENVLWQEKPFSKGQAWVDMIFRCNHICKQMGLQYQNVWVLRGQFLLSNIKLAEVWGWHEKTVRRFMKYLGEQGMIKYFSFNKFSIYELTKYAEFQALDTEGLQEKRAEQKPSRSRAEAEQKPTNKNVNNYKELKELINIYAPDEKLNKSLIDFLDMRIKKNKEPTTHAMELIFKTLKPFDIETQIKMLEKSTINSWTDVFALKQEQQNVKGNPPANKGNFDQRPIPNDEEINKLYKDV